MKPEVTYVVEIHAATNGWKPWWNTTRSLPACRKVARSLGQGPNGFQCRIVRVTTTREVVKERQEK